MFDLIAAGAMPFSMSSLISSRADALGNTNFPIIMSVPVAAVVLVIIAWGLEATRHPKIARLTAALALWYNSVGDVERS